MKIFEQLDNAYKKALQNFEPAPSDDQWQRLAVALKNEQKARRRKFIFLLSSFLLIAVTASYLLLPGKNDNIVQTKNTVKEAPVEVNSLPKFGDDITTNRKNNNGNLKYLDKN